MGQAGEHRAAAHELGWVHDGGHGWREGRSGDRCCPVKAPPRDRPVDDGAAGLMGQPVCIRRGLAQQQAAARGGAAAGGERVAGGGGGGGSGSWRASRNNLQRRRRPSQQPVNSAYDVQGASEPGSAVIGHSPILRALPKVRVALLAPATPRQGCFNVSACLPPHKQSSPARFEAHLPHASQTIRAGPAAATLGCPPAEGAYGGETGGAECR